MNSPDRRIAIPNDVSASSFREALSCFATGVVIVTTVDPNGNPVGMTVDSFNSVSMDPPLILWSVALSAPSLPAYRTHPSFVVNVVSDTQTDLCKRFAQSGADKFAGVQWHPGLHGAPVLADTVATLQCIPYRQYEGGDHEIHLGRVVDTTTTDRKPLIFNRGLFGKFQ